jgi:hypothetical protein
VDVDRDVHRCHYCINMSQAAVPLQDDPVAMILPAMVNPSAPAGPAWRPNEVERSEITRPLLDQGYMNGLIEALIVNKQAFAQSIWVVDNSGSMNTRDGHRMVQGKSSTGALKCVECSRWTEMQQTVEYHAQMAALLRAPTIFRLLTDPGRIWGPQIFSIAVTADPVGKSAVDEELSVAIAIMQNTQPSGVTPLAQHLLAIREHVFSMQSHLHHSGTKMAIVLATDGLTSDSQGYSNDFIKREFVSALRSLEVSALLSLEVCTSRLDCGTPGNALDNQHCVSC